ncbi:MAG: TolC family outer membrane protein [Gammaproteobacteria bacterium]|nr:TolC family outer membrane protein [Gammaproteobacteria bacterium]
MKHRIGFFLATAIVTFFHTSSQAMDLVQTLNLAQERDIQLMIARNQLDSIRYILPQAQSANRPQINLGANATFQDSGNTLSTNDERSIAGLSLSLSQNLYNAETFSRSNAAEANIFKAEADFKSAQQDLIIRATEAYFHILSTQDSVEFVQAEKNAIGRQLEQAKKRFEVGLIAITDVKEAQATYDFALFQVVIADNDLVNAREALQLIIGQPLNEELTPLGETVDLVIPEPASRSAWVEQAQKNNLNITSAQAGLQVANENRRIAKSGRNPTVNLVANYQANAIDSDVSGSFDTDELTLSVQLNMPLYTGGRTGAAISQAEADFAAAQNNLFLQKRLTNQQTRNAYLAVVSGIEQVRALEQAVISTKAALEATEAGFDVGTRTSVDVLNSLRETFRSKRDYASARYLYLINTLRLKQAAGLLSENDIPAINQWLSK